MGTGIVLGLGFLLLALAAGGRGGGGGNVPGTKGTRDKPIDGPGTGPINPGPNNEGPPPVNGPGGTKGWGGGQYGTGPIPGDFNWGGNWIYISPSCDTVAEAWRFMPIPGSDEILGWFSPERPSLMEVLETSFQGQNRVVVGSAYGYIAHLLRSGIIDGSRNGTVNNPSAAALQIATRILIEAASDLQNVQPDCALDDPQTWPRPMQDWWIKFTGRIQWVLDNEDLGGLGGFDIEE